MDQLLAAAENSDEAFSDLEEASNDKSPVLEVCLAAAT